MTKIPDHIHVVIFDFGEVLIELDYPKIIRGFSNVANKNHHEIEEMVVSAPLLQDFEVGKISPEEFRKGINNLLGTSLTTSELHNIWNSILKRMPAHRLQWLEEIGNRYDTYILSNTNEIHEKAFDKIILEASGKPSLDNFVRKVYFSHEIGLRKPSKECYEYVAQDIGVPVAEILFLDDRQDNIEGARSVGWQTIQITDSDKQLKEIFNIE